MSNSWVLISANVFLQLFFFKNWSSLIFLKDTAWHCTNHTATVHNCMAFEMEKTHWKTKPAWGVCSLMGIFCFRSHAIGMLKYSPTLALELGIGPGQYIDGRGRSKKQMAQAFDLTNITYLLQSKLKITMFATNQKPVEFGGMRERSVHIVKFQNL